VFRIRIQTPLIALRSLRKALATDVSAPQLLLMLHRCQTSDILSKGSEIYHTEEYMPSIAHAASSRIIELHLDVDFDGVAAQGGITPASSPS
jgi:hypothetical protein